MLLFVVGVPAKALLVVVVWLVVGSVDGAAPLLLAVARHRRAAMVPLATPKGEGRRDGRRCGLRY